MDNGLPRDVSTRRHVGVKTNLRGLALFLSAGRRCVAVRVNVREQLVLAHNLFRSWTILPGRRSRRVAEAARLARQ